MTPKRKIELIIFDCDGVLVDSEMISAGILQGMTAEIGLPMSDEMFRHIFLGRSFQNATARAHSELGFKFPADFEVHYRDRLFKALSAELKAMTGVVDVLSNLQVPFCVATGSTPLRLALTLEVAGLTRFFKENRFSASEVAHGKPAPDLCFFSAHKMNVDPKNCLVIEDSETGVLAAIAANMEVWHFAGGAHVKSGYHLPPTLPVAKVIDNMPSLRLSLIELGICK